jgi:hypothetical protein
LTGGAGQKSCEVECGRSDALHTMRTRRSRNAHKSLIRCAAYELGPPERPRDRAQGSATTADETSTAHGPVVSSIRACGCLTAHVCWSV